MLAVPLSLPTPQSGQVAAKLYLTTDTAQRTRAPTRHPHCPGGQSPRGLSSHSTCHIPGLCKQSITVPRKQQHPVRGPSSTGPGATGLQQTAGRGHRARQYWKELRSHLVQLSNSRMGKPRHGTRPCTVTRPCGTARKEREGRHSLNCLRSTVCGSKGARGYKLKLEQHGPPGPKGLQPGVTPLHHRFMA